MSKCISCDIEAARQRQAAQLQVQSNAIKYAKNNGLSEIVVYKTQKGQWGFCRTTDDRLHTFTGVEYLSVR